MSAFDDSSATSVDGRIQGATGKLIWHEFSAFPISVTDLLVNCQSIKIT